MITWESAARAVRECPDLWEVILEAVMASMILEGFVVTRERSEELLDQALNGPPLEYREEAER